LVPSADGTTDFSVLQHELRSKTAPVIGNTDKGEGRELIMLRWDTPPRKEKAPGLPTSTSCSCKSGNHA